MRRARGWLALAALAGLAIAGQLVFRQGVLNITHSQGQGWTFGFDFWPIWIVGFLFLHGQPVPHWYGAGVSNAWPPPHEVLLAPFGLLDFHGAQAASILATAALMVFALVLWSEAPAPARSSQVSWPLLLSAPVFAVVLIDQLQAALGLAALSVAIWAQRKDRWWLVGIAAAVGMIRVLNAIPILCILLLSGWGKPRQLASAAGAAAAFMAPLLFVSYLWDHTFVTDYIAGLTAYPYNAAPKAATQSFGIWGLPLLLALSSGAALWLLRNDAGRPLDPGRAGLAMALSVAITPLGGLYPAIFVLPAVIRLGRRPGFAAVPWIAAAAPWIVILMVSPWLLRPQPGMALSYLSFIDYGLVALCYPLLRIPPEGRRGSGEPLVGVSAA